MSVAYVDCETTGLDPDRNPIWEIAVIVDDVEYAWQQRLELRPPSMLDSSRMWTPRGTDWGLDKLDDHEAPPVDRPWISKWVVHNTGIDERYDHATALSPVDSIARFVELVNGRHLVGAVPSFDEERMRRLCRLHINPRATQFPWHYHLIDVEALMVGWLESRGHVVGLPWKSDDLSRAIGVEPPSEADRHSALGDARWAKAIYERIMG